MAEISLVAETGRPTGSRASNRLRAEGKVPGVVYGHGAEPVAVAVAWRELRHALTTEAGLNALIDLSIGGDTQLTIVKELQRDPVRRKVTHVDFIRISRDEAITVEVPISLEGEAEAVLREDGLVDQVMFELSITCKPGAIPNEIAIDVSGLQIGDSIRVGDLRLPEGVVTEVDADEPIVVAQAATLEIPEEAEAEEEGAEAEAEGADAGEAGGSAAEGTSEGGE
jgi:large subunit ribosomal protein L25